MSDSRAREWHAVQRWALVVAAVGIAVCAAGAFWQRQAFFAGLLVGWMYWTGIGVGCLGLLLLNNVTGGAWGAAIRRQLVAGASGMALSALLFLPLAAGLADLYPWARPDVVAHDPMLQHKQPYLNVPFFLARAAGYFVVWLLLLGYVGWRERRAARTGSPRDQRVVRMASAQGLLLYGLTVTFAAVDWGMSLEPHWTSHIYGVLLMIGQALSGLAFCSAALLLLPTRDIERPLPPASSRQDLGTLLLAFTMLWAYMSLSQFLIIWYANIPEEATWYVRRTQGGWQWAAGALVALHFFVPFALLLSRQLKRNPRALAAVAVGLLAMRWVDLVWLIEPAFDRVGPFVPWLDLAATAAMGGLWIAFFAWRMGRTEESPDSIASDTLDRRAVSTEAAV
jgi:hypothetical protein